MAGYIESRRDGRIDLAAESPLSKPLAIYLEPTNICNFGSQCYFCPQHVTDYKAKAGYYQHIPLSIVHKVVEDIKAMGGVKSIKLHFLGEGTLHPQLGEIARLCCSVCSDVMLTTNGTRLDAKKSEELIDAGLSFVRVSIYEETKTSVQASILANVIAFKQIRDSMGKTSPRIVAKWLSDNPAFAQAIRLFYDGVADEFLYEGIKNSSAFVSSESIAPLGKQIACPMPFYQMIVKANGDIAPCCTAWDTELNVGNVMEDSLLNIWNGEKLARIHRLHLEGRRKELASCKDCQVLWTSTDSVDDLSVEEYNKRRKQ